MKLGYVIANDNEEYLAGHSGLKCSLASPSFYVWSKDPVLAVCFPKHVARHLLKLMKYPEPLWVLQLYETESQFFVGTYDKKRPSWLS